MAPAPFGPLYLLHWISGIYLNMLGFQCVMQVHQRKYLRDHRRKFSSCEPSKEWPHRALHCYNESLIEFFAWNGKHFHDGGPYHMKTSPLIYSENQWTDFYMIGTSVMKELIVDRLKHAWFMSLWNFWGWF